MKNIERLAWALSLLAGLIFGAAAIAACGGSSGDDDDADAGGAADASAGDAATPSEGEGTEGEGQPAEGEGTPAQCPNGGRPPSCRIQSDQDCSDVVRNMDCTAETYQTDYAGQECYIQACEEKIAIQPQIDECRLPETDPATCNKLSCDIQVISCLWILEDNQQYQQGYIDECLGLKQDCLDNFGY